MSVRGSPCYFSAIIDHIMARRIADIYNGSTVVDCNHHHVDFYFQMPAFDTKYMQKGSRRQNQKQHKNSTLKVSYHISLIK